MKSKCSGASVPCLFAFKVDGRLVSVSPVAIRDVKQRCEKIDKDQSSGFAWAVSSKKSYLQRESGDKPQTSGVQYGTSLQATSPWFLFFFPSFAAFAPGALALSDWLVVTGTCFLFFRSVGNFITPIDELLFFRGVGLNHQPAS